MKPHVNFFEHEGNLVRSKDCKIIRTGSHRQVCKIDKGKEFTACLRYGRFTFPGSYEIFYITSDGGTLCYDCALNEQRSIIDSIRNSINDGWRVVASDATCNTDSEVKCDHCDHLIQPEWQDDEN